MKKSNVLTTNFVLSGLFVSLAGIRGCGAPSAMEATVEQDAYAQIEGLGDAAGNEEMFAAAFVSGSVPDNREDYAARGYQIAGEAEVDGHTATVPVKIFGGVSTSSERDRSSAGSSVTGETEQTWTLQQSGDEWKIQSAPLE